MRVAQIGSRGLGSNYSGIETALDQLVPRLPALGWNVDVYGRRDVRATESAGVRSIPMTSFGGKHFENLSRSGLSTLRSFREGYDVTHFHAIGPGILSVSAAITRRKSVVSIHGLDYRRAKWGKVAKFALTTAERTLVRCADEIIVCSEGLATYFSETYGRQVVFIPYGFTPKDKVQPSDLVNSFGTRYILFASRLTQEKGCHELIEAFQRVTTDAKLVMAGSGTSEHYVSELRSMADPKRVIFVGHRTGAELAELYSNAFLHILPSHIEGMSNSLLESLAFKTPSLVSDIEENRVVIDNDGFYFKVGNVDDLQSQLTDLLGHPEAVEAMTERLGKIQKDDWDEVARKHEAVYRKVSA